MCCCGCSRTITILICALVCAAAIGLIVLWLSFKPLKHSIVAVGTPTLVSTDDKLRLLTFNMPMDIVVQNDNDYPIILKSVDLRWFPNKRSAQSALEAEAAVIGTASLINVLIPAGADKVISVIAHLRLPYPGFPSPLSSENKQHHKPMQRTQEQQIQEPRQRQRPQPQPLPLQTIDEYLKTLLPATNVNVNNGGSNNNEQGTLTTLRRSREAENFTKKLFLSCSVFETFLPATLRNVFSNDDEVDVYLEMDLHPFIFNVFKHSITIGADSKLRCPETLGSSSKTILDAITKNIAPRQGAKPAQQLHRRSRSKHLDDAK